MNSSVPPIELTQVVSVDKVHRLLNRSVRFSFFDLYFGRFIAGLAKVNQVYVLLAAALVSSHQRNGHICIDLKDVSQKPLPMKKPEDQPLLCPELELWRERLMDSGVVGTNGASYPLILDSDDRIYLCRYWRYQESLGEALRCRVGDDPDIDCQRIRQGLYRFFPGTNVPDWQKIAAFTALVKRLCVISGGPGTGKTTTVFKILALLQETAGDQPYRIALCAPTGKAAARLSQAIIQSKTELATECGSTLLENIPDQVSTIHRLLKTRPGTPYFYHDRENPLNADVVVVDESSMVDMALMSKLAQALKPQARLILLGDMDQLASVEAGAVFGDICDTGHQHGFSAEFNRLYQQITQEYLPETSASSSAAGINDCVIRLEKNYRFDARSGIGELSRSVRAGNVDRSLLILSDQTYPDIIRHPCSGSELPLNIIENIVTTGYKEYCTTSLPEEKFPAFDRFRVLCALREGIFGVRQVNALIERLLAKHYTIKLKKDWYPGRPIMINRNNYHLRLFNGDVGLVLPDETADGALRVFFQTADNTIRRLHPARLVEHETVFAMTVHKSQGSEFDEILLILPDKDYPLLTRELIYTAITRARQRVHIISNDNVFTAAVKKRSIRYSGLRDILWK